MRTVRSDRGSARRHLCRPHQPAGRTLRCRRHGARLQKSQRRRARLPATEDRRSRIASSVPLDRAAGARPRLAVHAGLLSAMAHAPKPRPDAVRRARSGRPRGAAHLAGGDGRALTGGTTQGHRVDRPAPAGSNYINSLRSKEGKVRTSSTGLAWRRAARSGIGEKDTGRLLRGIR